MVSHFNTGDDSPKVAQPTRILSISKLEEISNVLPMITELGEDLVIIDKPFELH